MALCTSLGFWSRTFLATLGLPIAACGGTTTDAKGDGPASGGGDGGSAGQHDVIATSGGTPAMRDGGPGHESGGTLATGGTLAAGGTLATGGAVARGGALATGGKVATGGGVSTGGAVSSGGAVGTGGVPDYRPCTNAAPAPGIEGTGLGSCSGGWVHRVGVPTCPSMLPRSTTCAAGLEDPGGTCRADTECTDYPNGYCETGYAGRCGCVYGCTKDADCGEASVCLCGDPVGHCVPAACAKDADCALGALCQGYTGCGGMMFACQTTRDMCATDTDCGSPFQCSYAAGAHSCQLCGSGGSGGRPFLVLGEARLAPILFRDDFASRLEPRVQALSKGERAALAAWWTELARMEHASIAAFARFSLELLSLGAPSSLVAQASDAMADEIRHTRDAFALAGAYSGRAVGPGALAVDGSLTGRSQLDMVRSAVLEGCVGETIAAVEAAEALAHATEPAVRDALTRIVADETRHAQLAWRFVQWVLEAGPPELAAAAARDLTTWVDATASLPSLPDENSADSAEALLAHGVVPVRVRDEIRRRVHAEVIAPCARALAFDFAARGSREAAGLRDRPGTRSAPATFA